MSWLRVDDGFPRHRKVAALSDRAFRLHVTAMADCCDQLTDGFVAESRLKAMPGIGPGRWTQPAIKQLVDQQLWHVRPGGWMIHDFLEWNPSGSEVRKRRAAAKQRSSRLRTRERTANERRTNGEPISRERETNGERFDPVPVPVPTKDLVGTKEGQGDTNPEPDQEPDLLNAHDRPEVRAFEGQFADTEQAKTLERARARRERTRQRTQDALKKRRERAAQREGGSK